MRRCGPADTANRRPRGRPFNGGAKGIRDPADRDHHNKVNAEGDRTSRQISGYALPRLIKAVLQKQTANVGYVSGASYTTQGLESSVQSAIQSAGLA